jgi:hypothetical protein
MVHVAFRHSAGSDPFGGNRPIGRPTSPKEGKTPDATSSEPGFQNFGASLRSPHHSGVDHAADPRQFRNRYE